MHNIYIYLSECFISLIMTSLSLTLWIYMAFWILTQSQIKYIHDPNICTQIPFHQLPLLCLLLRQPRVRLRCHFLAAGLPILRQSGSPHRYSSRQAQVWPFDISSYYKKTDCVIKFHIPLIRDDGTVECVSLNTQLNLGTRIQGSTQDSPSSHKRRYTFERAYFYRRSRGIVNAHDFQELSFGPALWWR